MFWKDTDDEEDEPEIEGVEKHSWEWDVATKCTECVVSKEVIANQDDPVVTKVEAYRANYGNFLYWRVSCDRPCSSKHDSHPLCMLVEKEPITEAREVVPDNPHTRMTIQWIAMTDAELEQYSGSTAGFAYRQNLVKSISLFWD
jgi:hypothetical protein